MSANCFENTGPKNQFLLLQYGKGDFQKNGIINFKETNIMAS